MTHRKFYTNMYNSQDILVSFLLSLLPHHLILFLGDNSDGENIAPSNRFNNFAGENNNKTLFVGTGKFQSKSSWPFQHQYVFLILSSSHDSSTHPGNVNRRHKKRIYESSFLGMEISFS